MDMICRTCGNIFDEGEGKVIEFRHDEVDGYPNSERFLICPCCGSDAIEDAVRCKHCGGSFLPDKLIAGYYCSSCMAEFMVHTRYPEKFAMDNLFEFAEFVHEKEVCECRTEQS